ncbi:MAG: hypothetical protein Q9166_001553 [cf. Caloplaca sp. 2 TL-2023]
MQVFDTLTAQLGAVLTKVADFLKEVFTQRIQYGQDSPAVSLSTSIIELSYVTKAVVDKGVKVRRKSTTKIEDDKDVLTLTKLEISSSEFEVSIEQAWQQAVDELGREGHYIPRHSTVAAY